MHSYLKDPKTGDVFLEGANPIGYWTATEWGAEIKTREDRLAILQDQLDSMPKLKSKPDQETLNFYNFHVGIMLDQGIENQISRIQSELDDMKAV